ncbi:cobyrinate a,c-diamide synthase [Gordonibacter massiliensis (ex Traore et al. 2017)]|uniref:Hydrogenobyrinate a,c-diamide synthase n=1 Tax=Gordonibacter massiliensis (ex Traore et al. 2017) TaxID=1841863 RepID=A0A842JFN7_9ACTN|nr:cobyrinate a,c-diamide synthase [Gordonibacter massiliensis (ex Traore et al. 2017)]MBC2888645.1 cobyrinate a,c-diamide synthase [Gordonibacter massiliensis (ex Traore et al. 2017)]
MHEKEGTPLAAIPRVMIAAPHGRSGKTVLTLGLLRALRQRDVDVRPFKKGCDFIDPGWHALAAKATSRNLDRYFMEPDQLREVMLENAVGADMCVVEAAMGLYDGLDVEGSCSSAEIAKLTATPVILVVDVTRMTRTAAALVMGCCAFDPDVRISGVILNKVRGQRQRELVTQAIERYCDVPVVGSVPQDAGMDVPDRHLGLVTGPETRGREELLDGIAAVVARHVDLDAVRFIARCAGQMPRAAEAARSVAEAGLATETLTREAAEEARPAAEVRASAPNRSDASAVVAVMRDEAFSFYYPENLLALERAGARLTFVSSLADAALPPDADGLYIGGGFPEEHAARLQANAGMRESVRAAAERGMPVYAECGGLMYLGRRLSFRGATYDMAGALGFDTVMHEKQRAHGYALAVVRESDSWLPAGAVLKGHEHHHSQVVDLDPALPLACEMRRGRGVTGERDGLCRKGIVAGYLHVNAIASPAWAPSFVQAAARYRALRQGL